ncbi:MAG: immunoglobulin domain-containing protein, partial [Bifidobacteriaceae bacterium]|nr:immunoglobulin domain-containing protein [Bifidobacteriaceae bacterium]
MTRTESTSPRHAAKRHRPSRGGMGYRRRLAALAVASVALTGLAGPLAWADAPEPATPVITVQPVGSTEPLLVGDTITLKAEATGYPEPTVIWKRYISASTPSSTTVCVGLVDCVYGADVTRARSYWFTATFTNASGSVVSDRVQVQWIDPDVTTTAHPAAARVLEGQPAIFSAGAEASHPDMPAPTCQWQSQAIGETTWVDIDGATGSDLVLPDVVLELDGSQYRCVWTTYHPVTGAAITKNSGVATLTVLPTGTLMPVITKQPEPVSVTTSATEAVFSVEASGGSGPFTYRWQYRGSGRAWYDIGETNATRNDPTVTIKLPLAINNFGAWSFDKSMQNADGTFRVVVSDGTYETTSLVASLEVTPTPLEITTQPTDNKASEGADAVFEVKVSGDTGEATAQWEVSDNGTTWTAFAVGGADPGFTGLYRLTVPAADIGEGTICWYRLVLTGPVNTVTSDAAKLTGLGVLEPTLTTDKAVYSPGEAITFSGDDWDDVAGLTYWLATDGTYGWPNVVKIEPWAHAAAEWVV